MIQTTGPGSQHSARRAEAYLDWLLRNRSWIAAVALALAVVAGWRTVLTYASLRSELEELLPRSAPSVTALGELRRRLPGQRFLGIVVDTGPERQVGAAERFVDDLAKEISAYPPEIVLAVRSDISVERDFLERYALQLMDPADVRKLRLAVEARRDWELSKEMDLGLDDEAHGAPPPIPIEELQQKYLKSAAAAPDDPRGRFVSKDGRTAVLVVQINSHTTGVGGDRLLLERIQQDIRKLGFPDRYHPSLSLGYAADLPARVEEMDGLYRDLTVSALLVSVLVLGMVVWFFRSWRALPILSIPLLFGTLYTFGLVALPPLGIRSLNTNTTFLGSVIVGNGVNSGIILLGRYAELRGKGQSLHAALAGAIRGTVKPTGAAALAAATAYGSLVLTDFRGFTQFGWIGGLGMLTCWVTTFVLAPLLVAWLGVPIRVSTEGGSLARWLSAGFQWLLKRPRSVVVASTAITSLTALGLFYRDAPWVEHDYSKLRRSDSFVSGERYWGGRMDKTLGRYLTPTVILASSTDAANKIAAKVHELQATSAAGNLIATLRTATQVLPDTRVAAIEEARKLDAALTPRLRASLEPRERERIERALSRESLVPLDAEEVPPTLISGLRENDGTVGRSLLVYPKATGGTWDGPRITAYTEDLRRVARAVDPQAVVAGGIPLSSDITAAMGRDGPIATLFGLIAALVVCFFAFNSWWRSTLAVLMLLLGGVWMLGGLAWTPATFNFANFVVLPITFGISADYAINVLRRYGYGAATASLTELSQTCGAVALCSATTIIGFGSLLAAKSNALFSFGVFAVAGEVTMLATATLLLPSVVSLLGGRHPSPEALQSKEAQV